MLVVAACGSSPDGPSTSLPRVISAPSTLAADGSVPFVDEPGGPSEFQAPPPVAPDPGDAKPCKAEQLVGVLPRWISQGAGGNEPGRRPVPGLYGFAEVSSRDGSACTLRGRATTRLRIAGKQAQVAYAGGVTEEALRRTSLVDRDHRAELRVDWSPPYCGPAGPQQLDVSLPDDGGTLTITVVRPRTPACSTGSAETGSQLRTVVRGPVFSQYQPPTRTSSPLQVLRAALEGAPTSVGPGERVDFQVRLTNPTSQAVPLRPCPGFYLERFVLGVGRAGFNHGQVYRLNCRPVTDIPARSDVLFQMQAQVPEDPPGGPMFSVTWRLIAPYLAGEDALRVAFSVPIRT